MKSKIRTFKTLLSLEGLECFEDTQHGRCLGESSAAPTPLVSPPVDKQSVPLTDVFPLIRPCLCPMGPLANVGVPLGKAEPGFTFCVPKHFLIHQQSLRFFLLPFCPFPKPSYDAGRSHSAVEKGRIWVVMAGLPPSSLSFCSYGPLRTI